MKKLVKTFAVIMDLLFMPIRIIVALEIGLVMVLLYDDYNMEYFWSNVIVSNVMSGKLAFQLTPTYLVKIWKGEKLEIL